MPEKLKNNGLASPCQMAENNPKTEEQSCIPKPKVLQNMP
jgi:hypothetical protein